MKNSFRKTLLASLVVPFALGAASASAAPITNWTYDVVNSFSDANFTAADGDLDGTPSALANSLSWGGTTPATRSSISITNVSSSDLGAPVLITNDPAIMGGVLTHTNNAIDARYRTLTSFKLASTLQLAPDPQVSPALNASLGVNFQSFFTETPNRAPCVVGGDATVCDDIFTLENPLGLGVGAVSDGIGGFTFADSFDFDGYTYTVLLELLGLTSLGTDLCTAAGAASDCVGLVTREGEPNNFDTRFSISAQAVPEPGTLALLGLGLAGLGLSRRKKAAKA